MISKPKGLLGAHGAGLALVACLALAACASPMKAEECASADWAAVGIEDGRRGETPELFEKRAKACRSHGYEVDEEAYRTGRETGLEYYCSPDGAFAAGSEGLEYHGVCPQGAEPAFLAKYELGLQLFELTKARDEAVADLEAAITSLDRHYYNLRIAEKRYDNPNLSAIDRENSLQDVEYHRREIARIEHNLPAMNEAIENARQRLEAFQNQQLKHDE